MSALHTAILQTEKHEDTSDRYAHINTKEIMDVLTDAGFQLDNTAVSRVRKETNEGFQKHMVTMTYEALRSTEGVPTVIIRNSHNRTSGLQLHTGYIRFACSNGLILGTGIEDQKIRHSMNWADKANKFLDGYLHEVARMEEEHQQMTAKQLTRYDMYYLANEAAKIRYDLDDVLDPMELNLVRREADRGLNLYKAYNRMQEALIQGHFQRRTKALDQSTGQIIYSDWGKANRLTSQDEIIRVNKEIRELCLSVA